MSTIDHEGWGPGDDEPGEDDRCEIFPWEHVEASRRGPALRRRHPELEGRARHLGGATGCPTCRKKPEELAWVYFESPRWTWEHLCGRAGWITICDPCHRQIDFFLELMN